LITDILKQIFRFIENHLEVNGIALIASKRYYFGVGGGVALLENLISSSVCLFDYQIIMSVDDGKSNIRDVVKLKRTR
jgi:hypothetical protein